MILFLLALLAPSIVQAAVICDSASSTAMQNPPMVREVSVNVPDRPAPDRIKQFLMVSVTARGIGNPNVASLQLGALVIAPEDTRDKDNPLGVRVYKVMNPSIGHQTLIITYSAKPSADAVLVAICTGLKVGAPIGAIAKTTTGDRREVLTLNGDDDSTEELRVVGSDATKAELAIETPGLWFRSHGEALP